MLLNHEIQKMFDLSSSTCIYMILAHPHVSSCTEKHIIKDRPQVIKNVPAPADNDQSYFPAIESDCWYIWIRYSVTRPLELSLIV